MTSYPEQRKSEGQAELPPRRQHESGHRAPLFSALLRTGGVLLSVLLFGLSAQAAVVLFVFEAWVYMTLRAAVDGAFDGTRGRLSQQLVWLPLIVFGAGLIYGAVLAPFAFLIFVVVYGANNLSTFFAELTAEQNLLKIIATLMLVELIDATRHAAAVRRGLVPPPHSLQLTFMRVAVLLLPAALLYGAAARGAASAWVMLIATLLSILLFEGIPNQARRWLNRKRPG
jgi:hypothetical protein